MEFPRRLSLQPSGSLRDVILLSGAVRDLHKTWPQRYATEFGGAWPEIAEGSFWNTHLPQQDKEVVPIRCGTAALERPPATPQGLFGKLCDLLGSTIAATIVPTAVQGDIGLSQQEKTWLSQVGDVPQIVRIR